MKGRFKLSPFIQNLLILLFGITLMLFVFGRVIPNPERLWRRETPITAIAWSPDGKRLAAAKYISPKITPTFLADPIDSPPRGRIIVWDVESGERLINLGGQLDQIPALAWSPDGIRLASGEGLGELIVWNTITGDIDRVFEQHHVSALAWSPDGKWLAAGKWEGRVAIWDTSTGKEVITLGISQLESEVLSLAWSQDSNHLAASVWQHSLNLWDINTGNLINVLEYVTEADSLVWSPDGRQLAFVDGQLDGPIAVWDVYSAKELRIYSGPNEFFYAGDASSVAWSPDGSQLWSATGYNVPPLAVTNLDTKTGDALFFWQNSKSGPTSQAWSPDTKMLATGSHYGSVTLSDAQTGKRLLILE